MGKRVAIVIVALLLAAAVGVAAILTLTPTRTPVKIGLNTPITGPYFFQGNEQLRAAKMAVEEINNAGGIQGQHIELVVRDSKSRVDVTQTNVTDLIHNHKVKMVFGGSASSVAVATGHICQERGVPFFGTLTYSVDTTGKDAHRHTFRECYNSWMSAKVLGRYLKRNLPNKKYFYITADYTWGWTTEESMRKFTNTTDKDFHKGVQTPFPTAKPNDFRHALEVAEKEKPDVLVLVLFGNDMAMAIGFAAEWRQKRPDLQVVVPNITLGMAQLGGSSNMQGVLASLPWTWRVPYKYNYPRGKRFVEAYSERYGSYPTTSSASAYAILYEYKAAVERARTFASAAVIRALEGHTYRLLKDDQTWREFDHQSVQTVYVVRCNPASQVTTDEFKQDYFEIIDAMPGAEAAQTREEWNDVRRAAGKPTHLEPLPGD